MCNNFCLTALEKQLLSYYVKLTLMIVKFLNQLKLTLTFVKVNRSPLIDVTTMQPTK